MMWFSKLNNKLGSCLGEFYEEILLDEVIGVVGATGKGYLLLTGQVEQLSKEIDDESLRR